MKSPVMKSAHLALLAAAVARVAGSQSRRFAPDPALEDIASGISVHGYESRIDVYDIADVRYLRFMLISQTAAPDVSLEFIVGPQPDFTREDGQPDGSPHDPNSAGGTIAEYNIA